MKNNKDQSKNVNISDKELDRDLINLHLPEKDIVPDSLDVDDETHYDEDMKDWLKERTRKSNAE
jgi:hypothetical protein